MNNIISKLRDTYASNPAAALNLLPQLFQAEEDGLIIELPCKVGDTVWINTLTPCADCPNGAKPANVCLKSVCPQCPTPVPFSMRMLDNIGLTVFLTRAEAEERLESEKK